MSKKLFSTIALTFALTISGQAIFANTNSLFYDGAIEPNNTIEEATPILRNNADHPDKRAQEYFGEIGTLDDVDFYKVTLPTGKNTLIVQAYHAHLHVEILHSSGETFHEEVFSSKNQQHDFSLNANQAGTYYIRIATEPGTQTDLSKKPNYKLIIGNPYYSRGSYTVSNLSSLSINPRNKTSNTISFNLSNEKAIPDDAVVESIRFGGRETGSVAGRVRSVRASSTLKWYDGSEYWFEAKNISFPYSPVSLKQVWQYRHSAGSFYSTSYTLAPEVYFKYFYAQDLDNLMFKF